MDKKIRNGAIIAIVTVALMWTLTASAQDLYLASGNTPTKLYKVDLSTNEATYLMDFAGGGWCPCPPGYPLGYYFAAIAVTVDGKNLVAFQSRGKAVVHVDLTVDPPFETTIGDLPGYFKNSIFQASYDINDTLYFTLYGTNELYTLDLTNLSSPKLVGTVHRADGTPVSLVGADIAFDHDNTLYVYTNVGPSFWRVDTSTAEATRIGGHPNVPNKITGMAFTPDGRLVISCLDHHLYEISTTDATTTDLGTLTEDSTPVPIYGGDMARGAWSIPVEIDIKPGGDPDSINLNDQGLLPVAILGSTEFDVTDINPETIEVGGVNLAARGSIKAPKLAYSCEDVNSDGILDMMTFFEVQTLVNDGVLDENTTALTITATLYDGTPIEGTDSVNIVP